MILSGNVAVTGEEINACMDLVAKLEGNKPLGRTSCKREYMLKYIIMKCDWRA